MTEAALQTSTLDPAGQWYSVYEVLCQQPLKDLRDWPIGWHIRVGVMIDGEVRNGGWVQAFWNLRQRVSLPEMAGICAALGADAEAEQARQIEAVFKDDPYLRVVILNHGPFAASGKLKRLANRCNLAFYNAEPTLRVRLQEYIRAHRDDSKLAAVIAQAAPYEAYRNQSPLHCACDDGNIALVHRELARGVDPNIEDDEQGTPLMQALGRSKGPLRLEILDALIAAGADVNRRDWLGRAAPEVADMDPAVLTRLIAAGFDIGLRDKSGNTLLHQAPDATMARMLVKAGIDPNAASEYGMTPLHRAVGRYAEQTTVAKAKKALTVVRTLLKAGAVNGVTKRGQDVFWFAADKQASVRALMDLGLRVMTEADEDGREGRTALHRAIAQDDATLIHLLVEAGAPINARTRAPEWDGDPPAGTTPLALARIKTKSEVAEALVALGAEE